VTNCVSGKPNTARQRQIVVCRKKKANGFLRAIITSTDLENHNPMNIELTDKAVFVERFGPLYEHSDWIAERAFDTLQKDGRVSIVADELLAGMHAEVESADREKQMALICAHPDLAGRAAIAGELTSHSTDEQASARLDQCTTEEFNQFQSLNDRYKTTFGFPFIMAVRNRSRVEILEAFAERIDLPPETEYRNALDNIHQIARLRLQAMA